MGRVYRPKYTATVRDAATGEARKERRESKVWWIRYSHEGQRHEESSESTKKTDAQRLLALREGDKARGLPVSAKAGRLTFDAAVADVVTDYKVNGKRTTAKVEQRIRLHLAPFFRGRRMAGISTDDVRRYQAQRQTEGASNATINLELAILKRAFRLAADARTVLVRPHIPMLALNNVRKGFFEREEFEDVRARLPEHLRGVVTVAYLTGWRVPSEVLTLQWSQVNRREQTVRLEPHSTKNGHARELPYGDLPALVEVIERQWEEHERLAAAGTISPWVFSREGAPIRSFRGAWKRACEKAGVPGRILHDFRRSAARNLIRAGVSRTVAMEVTGHLTDSVFRRYDITDSRDLRQALGKLAGGAAGEERGKTTAPARVRRFPQRS